MGGVLSSLIMNKKKDMTNKESLLGKDKLGEDISKHFKWMFKRKNEILTMGTMTNLNKEIEKKFKKFCIKCFPEPIEKGEKILAISIDFEEALSFILSEVIPMVRKEEREKIMGNLVGLFPINQKCKRTNKEILDFLMEFFNQKK